MSITRTLGSGMSITREERAAGALLGVLVGDGLGFGMQWYYDRGAKDKDFGPWIENMVDPSPSGSHFFAYVSKYRHEQGLRAGDVSQLGQIFVDLMTSVESNKGFDRTDFLHRLDALFATLNGESLSGHYTDGIYIKTRKARLDGVAWESLDGTDETTGDGAILSVVLAALYSDPEELAAAAESLMVPLLGDQFIRGNSIVFALAVQALINGVPVVDLGAHVKALGSKPGVRKFSPPFDNFLSPGYGASAAAALPTLEPKQISLVYGDDCQLTHLLPAAYFLLHRSAAATTTATSASDSSGPPSVLDLEFALLSASNSGGQNVVRAAMAGALLGAAHGVGALPARWLQQLKGGAEMARLAHRVAKLGGAGGWEEGRKGNGDIAASMASISSLTSTATEKSIFKEVAGE